MDVDLPELGQGMPGLSPEYGLVMAQAASVCLDDQGHTNPVTLAVVGDQDANVNVTWQPVTEQHRNTWNDGPFATEQGAYGIAILVVRKLRGLTVLQRSRKGGGFDYWMGIGEEAGLFVGMTRLEVSGIRRGTPKDIQARVAVKRRQISTSFGDGGELVAVVEFGSPKAHIEGA